MFQAQLAPYRTTVVITNLCTEAGSTAQVAVLDKACDRNCLEQKNTFLALCREVLPSLSRMVFRMVWGITSFKKKKERQSACENLVGQQKDIFCHLSGEQYPQQKRMQTTTYIQSPWDARQMHSKHGEMPKCGSTWQTASHHPYALERSGLAQPSACLW